MKEQQFTSSWLAATLICSMVSSAGLVRGATLPEALDAPQLLWTTGGAANWFGQTVVTHDGVDAAECGGLTNAYSESWLQTTVTGRLAVVFWWESVAPGGQYFGSWFQTNNAYLDGLHSLVAANAYGAATRRVAQVIVSTALPEIVSGPDPVFIETTAGASGDAFYVDPHMACVSLSQIDVSLTGLLGPVRCAIGEGRPGLTVLGKLDLVAVSDMPEFRAGDDAGNGHGFAQINCQPLGKLSALGQPLGALEEMHLTFDVLEVRCEPRGHRL
ncbi:MAG TPA: hypothetical protein P5534_05520 [Candidatus Paceibacterota bacterium]|nr:hypothetical protein [Candidatus Paceibacterota bacterium]HRZ56105.1 hypothetical protein [Candidatus Paceibacterota bacterium]